MTRTDRRGRELRQFLQAEILGRDVTYDELREACGLTAARYYRQGDTPGRRDAGDFPNTEELRKLADFYQLGSDGFLNLLIEFDWLDARPDARGYSADVATLTRATPRTTRRAHQQAVAASRSPL